MELSRGDALKRETAARLLKLRVDQEVLGGASCRQCGGCGCVSVRLPVWVGGWAGRKAGRGGDAGSLRWWPLIAATASIARPARSPCPPLHAATCPLPYAPGITFQPAINDRSRSVEGRLRILEDPESYVARLAAEAAVAAERASRAAAEAAVNEMAECTFHPQVRVAEAEMRSSVRPGGGVWAGGAAAYGGATRRAPFPIRCPPQRRPAADSQCARLRDAHRAVDGARARGAARGGAAAAGLEVTA